MLIDVCHTFKLHCVRPERLLTQQAVQQVEAQFAKEMGAEAREKRIDR